MPGGMWSWSILILRRDRALFVKFVTSLSKIISISMIIRGAFMAFINAILISSAKQFLMMLHILILRRNTVPRWLRHVCEKRCQFWVPRLYNLSRVHEQDHHLCQKPCWGKTFQQPFHLSMLLLWNNFWDENCSKQSHGQIPQERPINMNATLLFSSSPVILLRSWGGVPEEDWCKCLYVSTLWERSAKEGQC